mmetsp:Transcript_7265/g.14915  ORF Transcript_7265/g.14915 Transcript_7265/m.14915 type:complete len:206 (+) Transcript_7265:397-1014(+)
MRMPHRTPRLQTLFDHHPPRRRIHKRQIRRNDPIPSHVLAQSSDQWQVTRGGDEFFQFRSEEIAREARAADAGDFDSAVVEGGGGAGGVLSDFAEEAAGLVDQCRFGADVGCAQGDERCYFFFGEAVHCRGGAAQSTYVSSRHPTPNRMTHHANLDIFTCLGKHLGQSLLHRLEIPVQCHSDRQIGVQKVFRRQLFGHLDPLRPR